MKSTIRNAVLYWSFCAFTSVDGRRVVDFSSDIAQPASNLKGLKFVSRKFMPYGPDAFGDNPTQSEDTTEEYRGFAFGLEAAEKLSYDRYNQYMYSLSELGYITVVDWSDPTNPKTVYNFNSGSEDIQDIEICNNGEEAFMMFSTEDEGLLHVWKGAQRDVPDTPPTPIRIIPVGELPNTLLLNSNCTLAIVTNENDGEGLAVGALTLVRNFGSASEDDIKVSIIPMDNGVWDDDYLLRQGLHMPLTKRSLEYWDVHSNLAADLDFSNVRENYRPAIFLEPEFLVFSSPEENELVVNLQENNGLMRIDIETETIISVAGYGLKDHGVVPIDINSDDGTCNLQTYPNLFSLRNPDSISSVRYNGRLYVLTANEGDNKDYEDWEDEIEASELFNVDTLGMANVKVHPSVFHPTNPSKSSSVLFKAALSPAVQQRFRGSAIYNAMHPEEFWDDLNIGSNPDGVGAPASRRASGVDVLDVHSSSMRRAARELLSGNRMRSRRYLVDVGYRRSSDSLGASFDSLGDTKESPLRGKMTPPDGKSPESTTAPLVDQISPETSTAATYGSIESGIPEHAPFIPSIGAEGASGSVFKPLPSDWFAKFIQQASAVAVVALLNIMIAIPFGASYFPIGWRANDGSDGDSDADEDDGGVSGSFPLPGKQALGIRMFLLATIMGQFAFTFASRFENPVGLQMVENVPFLHSLCQIVIRHQGYGMEALSTVFFLFATSSLVVGATFYALGKWQLGRIVYYFPNHVLVGCIGGIGVFIAITAIEVTTDTTFTFDMDGIESLFDNFNLLSVVLFFEVTLRILQHVTRDEHGAAKYPMLSPIYYCLITPAFYLGLLIFGVSSDSAMEQGYFFPPIADASEDGVGASTRGLLGDPHLWDVFRIIDFRTVSPAAVLESIGTMIALAAFSLIHVPINIPAFAISTDVDTDMNAELIAHGYANALSGIFGGLQTYMTYSNSVLYAKSGGKGVISSLGIIALSILLFVIGPSIASYLPRCMAGTLLLHIGIDLVLEGVYDSIGSYDFLEYAGIWAIALVMTIWGMTAALIAGVIAALTTYAVQSINHNNPIRQILTASTLRSSAWTRCKESRAILENEITGRSRILIFQLQGHLFFGNVAQLTDTIKEVLKEKKDYGESPIVVIVDFTLVVGMDSSAAHAVAKLKKIIHRLFHVEVSIFVTGSDRGGFPCEYALSEALSPQNADQVAEAGLDYNEIAETDLSTEDLSGQVTQGAISVSPGTSSVKATKKLTPKADGRVCESLDDALRFAEDILVARENSNLECSTDFNELEDYANLNMTLEEETFFGKKFLKDLLPPSENIDSIVETMWKSMHREVYKKNEPIWDFGMESDSMKLLVCGELLSIIEDTGASEVVKRANIVGELGLVHGTTRLTTLLCSSDEAVAYSLDKDDFERFRKEKPELVVAIDGVVIRYLAHRVQHVSNRYFHTTLPV